MSNDEVPSDIETKQTPENVWGATAICLYAIVTPLRRAGLISSADIRAVTDAVLHQLQNNIGEEWGPNGCHPPLDWNNYATIVNGALNLTRVCRYRHFESDPPASSPLFPRAGTMAVKPSPLSSSSF